MSWNYRSKYGLLIALALAIASMLLRYCAFTQTAFANGWDSYYYLVQLKSIEDTGQMHSPEGSLIYPYLRLFYWITSDYLAALKWGTALLCGLWTFLLYYFPRSWKMGLLLASWSVFSPHLSYFAAQYPKNLLGLLLFMALVLSLEKAKKNKTGIAQVPHPAYNPIIGDADFSFIKAGGGRNAGHFNRRTTTRNGIHGSQFTGYIPGVALALLVLNYFGHRMSFGLSMIYLLLHLLFQWRELALQSFLKPKYLFFSMLAMLFLILAWWNIPGLAQVVDIQRLEGTFSRAPQFAPWSFISSFGQGKISNYWLLEIGITLIILVVQAIQIARRAWEEKSLRAHKLALFSICLLLLFPFLKWSYSGLSWRFFLVFILLTPLLLWENKFHKLYWPSMLLLWVGAFFSWKSYNPALHDPNYALFSRISKNAEQRFDNGQKPELVITHNSLAEYFTFSTGIDAMPWLPEYDIDSTRLWRIASGVRVETLRYHAGQTHRSIVQGIGGGYWLLPEYVWQQACKHAAAEKDLVFISAANAWYNPRQMRPNWLLQKKQQ